MSRQLPKPAEAQQILRLIPADFRDDGCTSAPDAIFGFAFAWACLIHDFSGCTRCHAAGALTQERRLEGDNRLKRYIGASLPWRWRWVRFVYWAVLRIAGGARAWDSCGVVAFDATEEQVAAGLCRHDQPMPGWLQAQADSYGCPNGLTLEQAEELAERGLGPLAVFG